MEKNNFLSIIMPAYKQGKTISKDIKNLQSILEMLPYKHEIIVVVDGIFDDTHKQVFSLKDKRIRVISYEKNEGKGNAVKVGMLNAKGDIIGFIDAGMDISADSLAVALQLMHLHDADIVVGSKLHVDSIVSYPVQRRVFSWGYRMLTRLLFGFMVKDTQVGLKLFKKQVVKKVFPKLLVKRFAFDIEILAVAYRMGFTHIYESPIRLEYNWSSSISTKNFWIVIFGMLWDTAAVFYRINILHYYDKKK